MTESYGKFHESHLSEYVILENISFLPTIKDHLPSDVAGNKDFKQWLANTPEAFNEAVDLFMMTLPNPRFNYYQSSDAETISKNVIGYTNEVVEALGFF